MYFIVLFISNRSILQNKYVQKFQNETLLQTAKKERINRQNLRQRSAKIRKNGVPGWKGAEVKC